jgi:hypothetical protein
VLTFIVHFFSHRAENAKASGTSFYEKGASINRMFQLYLNSNGTDNYFPSLADHLQRHQYSNPMLPDLLDSFQRNLPGGGGGSLSSDVPKHMAGWLLQPGMPLITITLNQQQEAASATAATASSVTITQRPSAHTIKNQSQVWWLPLHLKLSCGDATSTMFVETTEASSHFEVTLPSASPTPSTSSTRATDTSTAAAAAASTCFVQGNYNSTGFFLVNYTDPANWLYLTQQMAEPDYPAIERQQLQKQLSYLAQLENSTGGTGTGKAMSASASHMRHLIDLYNERIVVPWADQQQQQQQQQNEQATANTSATIDSHALLDLVRGILADCHNFLKPTSPTPVGVAITRVMTGISTASCRHALHGSSASSSNSNSMHEDLCALSLFGKLHFGNAQDADGVEAWETYQSMASANKIIQFKSISELKAFPIALL